MKQKVILILVGLIFFNGCAPIQTEVCIEENCFTVEMADHEDEILKGLMYRESLDKDKGMLFSFAEEKIHSFWMKNTLIPLDMIWINSRNEIVYIYENAQPCEEDPCPGITPPVEARFVLEINGGLVEELGINIGDNINPQ
jgi:uncharacterized protein